jgi:hypothetical protein
MNWVLISQKTAFFKVTVVITPDLALHLGSLKRPGVFYLVCAEL